MNRCSQDHKKIQAGAVEGMTIRCGLCGINLSKRVTQAILAAKEAAK
jgi:predicted PP-loop superfamily ATPase